MFQNPKHNVRKQAEKISSTACDFFFDCFAKMGPSPRLPSQGRERERIRSASRDSRDSRPDPRRSLDRYSRDWHDTRNRRREILNLKTKSFLGGGSPNILFFHPENWGNDPPTSKSF